jgi:hypothetical protein
MVTMRGSVFGVGCFHQLDVVDPSAESRGKQPNIVSTPTEVFAVAIKSKGDVKLPDRNDLEGLHVCYPCNDTAILGLLMCKTFLVVGG